MNATIFDIQRGSYVDGPGIRTAVFFKGCHMRCLWCHNPEGQDPEPELMFYADKCIGCGKCREVCPNGLAFCDACGRCELYCPRDARKVSGRVKSAEDVMAEIRKDRLYYEASGGGVTFSGGECMLQIDFLAELVKTCHREGIHTAVDTAGDVPWEYFERILPYTALFLYDLKSLDPEKHVSLTGVSNERLLENLRRLSDESTAGIILRIPVVPGANEDELPAMAEFSRSLRLSSVELLPYHTLGEHKYPALARESRSFRVPSADEMTGFRSLFL